MQVEFLGGRDANDAWGIPLETFGRREITIILFAGIIRHTTPGKTKEYSVKFSTKLPILLSLVFLLAPDRVEGQQPKVKVPDSVVFEPNIEYSNPDGQHLQLDMARPKAGEGPFPAVVCIHGGGFRAGSRQGYDGLCIRLAEQGYVAVTVSYRLAPKYQYPAAIHDVKTAVRWLRANAKKYQVDPDQIGVTGGSAGGHLAQFLGVTADVKQFEVGGNLDQSSRVSCVVNYYGPSDFTKSYGKSVDAAQVLPLWLGGDLEQARQKHIQASPLYWVTPNAAPTLCIHGTEDKYVAHEQAVWIIDRLKGAGVEAALVTLEGAGHGFKGKDAETAEKAMLAFLDKHLKKK
jgi:acetyl esterase/lipase